MNSANHKNELRKLVLRQRKALSLAQTFTLSEKIIQRIEGLLETNKNLKIGSYISVNNEVLTSSLIPLFNNSKFYVPKIHKSQKGKMSFTPYDDLESSHSMYGIPETPTFDGTINPKELDIIFMPLVAFDRQGNRLGYGGGYYDRALSFKNETPLKKPTLIALAFDIQEIPAVPHEAWDIKPDLIITNKELIKIGNY